jgi:hypothetical protein
MQIIAYIFGISERRGDRESADADQRTQRRAANRVTPVASMFVCLENSFERDCDDRGTHANRAICD